MTLRNAIARLTGNETLNFVLTNCIPRRAATRLVGRLAKVRQPLVRDLSIAVWRMFSDLDLSEARTTKFASLHDCFIRELKEGARPVDRRFEMLTSPCDAIVGACGSIRDGDMLQVKGSSYPLSELLRDHRLAASYRNGCYATPRLTSTMYHRFHAPHDACIFEVRHIAGDTWNVNPPTLKRIAKVYCRNERAVIRMRLDAGGSVLTLVPVAAILVAGLRLRFLEMPEQRHHAVPWIRPCGEAVAKGQELGWFEHGSTIIVLAQEGFEICDGVKEGELIRMGRPLMRLPP